MRIITINGKRYAYTTFFKDNKEGKRQSKNWVGWKRRQGFLVRTITGKNTKGDKILRIYVADK